jgi:hypothetical protein
LGSEAGASSFVSQSFVWKAPQSDTLAAVSVSV